MAKRKSSSVAFASTGRKKQKAISNGEPSGSKKSDRKKDTPASYAEPSDDVVPSFDGEEQEQEQEEEEDEEVVIPVDAVAADVDVSTAQSQSQSLPVTRIPRNTVQRRNLDARFIGSPVPAPEATSRWPYRYSSGEEGGDYMKAKRHYLRAELDGSIIFNLHDHAHVASDVEEAPYICKIVEFFEGVDGHSYFRAQWYYRSRDTVIKNAYCLREAKRVFSSEIQDDNPLGCLLDRIKIIRAEPNLDVAAKAAAIEECDYYYDMKYLVPFSSFVVPPRETASDIADPQSSGTDDQSPIHEEQRSEMLLLDLYAGCGGMSTGLCMGANLKGVNLVTKWAIDLNPFACESLELNHPETEVRNESADDFLLLLKEWKKLCASYALIESPETHEVIDAMEEDEGDDEGDETEEEDDPNDGEVFVVEEIIGICYGDPKGTRKIGLHFKVHWKGYGPEEDTWEPVAGLGNCRKSIGDFVRKGFTNKTLPLPGEVDVVCGGPPCQGISGFNRFRNKENPLADIKNHQLIVYMDIIEYLSPKFLLMENVVDLLKFADGFCGRYALGRLVDMNYQARIGMMAAGNYGLPQFRMRVFLWGALPTESLPQYPLPTHDVVYKGVVPVEFEMNVVAHADKNAELEAKLFLGDAIDDLPSVENDEHRDEIPYGDEPKSMFQRFIRRTKESMVGSKEEFITTLYDHRPLKLNVDDHQRVCRIPKKKGANFRDLPGVRVGAEKKVEFDPDVPREYLHSGKPVVPDYAMTFVRGTSLKPFGRLWYDETVPTVVTRAEPHNQRICHPFQDRVLTIRENARLQGFPDYYQLKGSIKERYIQVGNAVAVPVSRALGYSLALASEGLIDDKHVLKLPAGFPLLRQAEGEINN